MQVEREVQITREKSLVERDPEAGIILSPVRYQPEMEKGSMETSSTSKARTVEEEFTMR